MKKKKKKKKIIKKQKKNTKKQKNHEKILKKVKNRFGKIFGSWFSGNVHSGTRIRRSDLESNVSLILTRLP